MILNPETLMVNEAIELVPFLENLAVGVTGLFGILWVNLFFLRRIAVYYEVTARIHLDKSRFNRVFLTYLICITMLMLCQVLAILCWGGFMMLLGLMDHPMNALLFAGSCYTTIGIISDVMPNAWRMQAIFISLSGLFAIALSTAAMLNMSPLFRQAWYRKHDHKIRGILAKYKVSIPELDALEGIIPPEKRDAKR